MCNLLPAPPRPAPRSFAFLRTPPPPRARGVPPPVSPPISRPHPCHPRRACREPPGGLGVRVRTKAGAAGTEGRGGGGRAWEGLVPGPPHRPGLSRTWGPLGRDRASGIPAPYPDPMLRVPRALRIPSSPQAVGVPSRLPLLGVPRPWGGCSRHWGSYRPGVSAPRNPAPSSVCVTGEGPRALHAPGSPRPWGSWSRNPRVPQVCVCIYMRDGVRAFPQPREPSNTRPCPARRPHSATSAGSPAPLEPGIPPRPPSAGQKVSSVCVARVAVIRAACHCAKRIRAPLCAQLYGNARRTCSAQSRRAAARLAHARPPPASGLATLLHFLFFFFYKEMSLLGGRGHT